MNKRTLVVWSVIDFLYLASAVVCFIFALAWRGMGPAELGSPSMLLRRLVVSEKDSLAALGLGSYIAVSFFLSLFAILHTLRTGSKTRLLSIFNASVLLAGLATIAVGSAVWFFTLTERRDFELVWLAQPAEVQAFLQDSLQCCGYWNSTAAGLFSVNTGFCAGSAIAANATLVDPCVTPITKFADNTLNNVFSTVYGFVVVQAALFLATCCVRQLKLEEERFRRIDEKRGQKGGFV